MNIISYREYVNQDPGDRIHSHLFEIIMEFDDGQMKREDVDAILEESLTSDYYKKRLNKILDYIQYSKRTMELQK